MGIIQNAINQTIGTAGIAAKLSPLAEKQAERQELRKLNKKSESLQSLQEGTDYNEATVAAITKEQAEVSKRIAELNPTKENVKAYLDYSESLEQMQPENIAAEKELAKRKTNIQRADEAMIKVAEKQESQKRQKNIFRKYRAKLKGEQGGLANGK